MELVVPSTEYEKSFLEAVEEFRAEKKQQDVEASLVKRCDDCADFSELVEKIRGEAEGKYLPEGYVPHTVYWLVDGKTFIGWLDIRHTLTDHLREVGGNIGYAIRPTERKKGYGTKILKLALLKAKEMGLTSIRITCDDTNTASARIIEKNGGVFENTTTTKEGIVKRRYWICL